jgi:hypothetical protein
VGRWLVVWNPSPCRAHGLQAMVQPLVVTIFVRPNYDIDLRIRPFDYKHAGSVNVRASQSCYRLSPAVVDVLYFLNVAIDVPDRRLVIRRIN